MAAQPATATAASAEPAGGVSLLVLPTSFYSTGHSHGVSTSAGGGRARGEGARAPHSGGGRCLLPGVLTVTAEWLSRLSGLLPSPRPIASPGVRGESLGGERRHSTPFRRRRGSVWLGYFAKTLTSVPEVSAHKFPRPWLCKKVFPLGKSQPASAENSRIGAGAGGRSASVSRAGRLGRCEPKGRAPNPAPASNTARPGSAALLPRGAPARASAGLALTPGDPIPGTELGARLALASSSHLRAVLSRHLLEVEM